MEEGTRTQARPGGNHDLLTGDRIFIVQPREIDDIIGSLDDLRKP